MKILGNKVCPVCQELNNKKRKTCLKCKCILKHTIKSTESRPDPNNTDLNNEFKIPLKYVFTLREL